MVAQFHHHVQVVRRLEGVPELEDVAVVELLHDLGLGDGIAHLVVADQLLLAHRLHGKDLPCVALTHPEDLAEGAFAEDLKHLEVREGKASLRRRDLFGLLLDDLCRLVI